MDTTQFLNTVVTAEEGCFLVAIGPPGGSGWHEEWFNWPNDLNDIVELTEKLSLTTSTLAATCLLRKIHTKNTSYQQGQYRRTWMKLTFSLYHYHPRSWFKQVLTDIKVTGCFVKALTSQLTKSYQSGSRTASHVVTIQDGHSVDE
jgi:hypothetical protein